MSPHRLLWALRCSRAGVFAAMALVGPALAGLAWAAAAQPAASPPPARAEPPTTAELEPRALPGLHNVVAYSHQFWSGSAPEGDAGFRTLAAMGVKTIISVDGAEPEAGKARAHGIRYIHLPIGYDGFGRKRRLELARAARDALAEGPAYIHCHHGKHRSASAAAAIVATLGWASAAEMVERMKVSGTAPGYKGLYACAASAAAEPAAAIDAIPPNFPEVSHPRGFVKSMVEIDEISERLKAIQAAGWTVPKDHPDLVPVAEAGRMADLLRLQIDGERARKEPADFMAMLKGSGAQVQKLEDLLAAGETDTKKLSDQFTLVSSSCTDCHVHYRD